MQVSFISLYVDQIASFFERGVIKRAIEDAIFDVSYIDLRSYAPLPHRKVDDYPYSHRQGMLLKADILKPAIDALSPGTTLLMPDPKGPIFDYSVAKSLSKLDKIAFVCPAYEGVDERIFDLVDIQRYSLGDFIVPTGDSPAVLMAEAVVRYLPGVLGCAECVDNDSILSGLLEAPHYTAPRTIDQLGVPDVLLSGNHGEIQRWKQRQSLRQTMFFRPDLINRFKFSPKLVKLIDDIIVGG
jgi:tRNA (guanine37-N1)-methyltransferase